MQEGPLVRGADFARVVDFDAALHLVLNDDGGNELPLCGLEFRGGEGFIPEADSDAADVRKLPSRRDGRDDSIEHLFLRRIVPRENFLDMIERNNFV